MKTVEKIILDSSAIINGFSAAAASYTLITVPAVVGEVQSRLAKENLQMALELGQVEQRSAKKEFIEKIKSVAAETGDRLSKTDAELLALALELKAEIATDDYGIQNIAKKLKISFISVGERGIKEVFKWQYYCPACWKKYTAGSEQLAVGSGQCSVCGTKLKRKRINL